MMLVYRIPAILGIQYTTYQQALVYSIPNANMSQRTMIFKPMALGTIKKHAFFSGEIKKHAFL